MPSVWMAPTNQYVAPPRTYTTAADSAMSARSKGFATVRMTSTPGRTWTKPSSSYQTAGAPIGAFSSTSATTSGAIASGTTGGDVGVTSALALAVGFPAGPGEVLPVEPPDETSATAATTPATSSSEAPSVSRRRRTAAWPRTSSRSRSSIGGPSSKDRSISSRMSVSIRGIRSSSSFGCQESVSSSRTRGHGGVGIGYDGADVLGQVPRVDAGPGVRRSGGPGRSRSACPSCSRPRPRRRRRGPAARCAARRARWAAGTCARVSRRLGRRRAAARSRRRRPRSPRGRPPASRRGGRR